RGRFQAGAGAAANLTEADVAVRQPAGVRAERAQHGVAVRGVEVGGGPARGGGTRVVYQGEGKKRIHDRSLPRPPRCGNTSSPATLDTCTTLHMIIWMLVRGVEVLAVMFETTYGVDFSGARQAGCNTWVARLEPTGKKRGPALRLTALASLERLCGTA